MEGVLGRESGFGAHSGSGGFIVILLFLGIVCFHAIDFCWLSPIFRFAIGLLLVLLFLLGSCTEALVYVHSPRINRGGEGIRRDVPDLAGSELDTADILHRHEGGMKGGDDRRVAVQGGCSGEKQPRNARYFLMPRWTRQAATHRRWRDGDLSAWPRATRQSTSSRHTRFFSIYIDDACSIDALQIPTPSGDVCHKANPSLYTGKVPGFRKAICYAGPGIFADRRGQ